MKKYSEDMLSWLKNQYESDRLVKEIHKDFCSLYFQTSLSAIQSVIFKHGWKRGTRNGCPYSKEELDWIKERYISGEYLIAQLIKMTNEYTRRELTLSGFNQIITKFGWRYQKKGMWQPLSKEEETWLVEQYKAETCWGKLAQMFAEKFYPISDERVAHAVRKYIHVKRRNLPRYEQDENKWLVDLLLQQKYTYSEIADMHNIQYPDRIMSADGVCQFARTRHIPLSKDLKHKIKVNASIKNGFEIGTESLNSQGHCIVKVKKGCEHENWKLKKVVEWERLHNKTLPRGWRVVCLDGDETNLTMENLYAGPYKKVVSSLGNFRIHHPSSRHLGADWTKAYLMMSELKVALNDKGVMV